jgi:hypothetical protein
LKIVLNVIMRIIKYLVVLYMYWNIGILEIGQNGWGCVSFDVLMVLRILKCDYYYCILVLIYRTLIGDFGKIKMYEFMYWIEFIVRQIGGGIC